MSNVLVHAHYFYPDVASTGQIIRDWCESLQYDHNITIIAAAPSYNMKEFTTQRKLISFDKHESITVIRVRVPKYDKNKKISRILNICSYTLIASIATILSGKQDIVFSISQPPVLGGVLGVFSKIIKKAKLIYNIQDFNPEQTEAVRYSKNKFLLSIAHNLDKLSCICSDKVLLVGNDQIETLKRRFPNKKTPAFSVINNWINDERISPIKKDDESVQAFLTSNGVTDKRVVMYSGNIGLYYDLENLIRCFKEFEIYEDVVFMFVGDGAIKAKLIDYCLENSLSNVVFAPYQKYEDLVYSLNAADIHIVTNAKGIKGVSVPSKIYGVLAVNKPVIGVLEKNSEVYNIISDSKCGLCSEPEDYSSFKRNLHEMLACDLERFANGRSYLDRNLSKKIAMSKYSDLLSEIVKL